MSPEIIWSKISELQEVLSALKNHIKSTRSEMEKSHYEIERLVQLCVDLSLSIARRILSLSNQVIPETGYDVFLALAKNKIISKKIAEQMADTVGLRNILIHEYDDINYDILFGGLKSGYGLFVNYCEKMAAFTKKTLSKK